MRAVLAGVLVGLAVSGAPGRAAAQQSYQQVVNDQLAMMAGTLRERGYNPVSQPITGSLNHGADQGQAVTLNAGRSYVIVAACDQDCRDVDLRIHGPDGRVLAEDVELDDTPVLDFTAPVAGQYRLVVMMANCRQNPCYWGAQIFAR